MRINKYLADSGVCSRRGADKLIEEGRVKLNGKTVKELGANVNENNDSVTVDGRKVSPVSTYTYLLFNKPKGCVSTVKDEKDRKTVMDFINIPGK
jgi:23S rRNA pseudouridine2605 synthase